MRIVAGRFRGKNLVAPDGLTTRPTADRTRESLFNILDSRLRRDGLTWAETTVFDAFAGTGALGLEALSRGASVLFAAEKDLAAQRCFRQNAAAFSDCSITLMNDVLNLPQAQAPVGLLLADPPYKKGLIAAGLKELAAKGWIDERTLCVAEAEKGEKNILPENCDILDNRIYGKAQILIFRQKSRKTVQASGATPYPQ